MRIRTNRRINLRRPTSISGFDATETLETVRSDIPAWVVFSKGMRVGDDGVEVGTDGEIRIASAFDIRERDVIEVIPDTEKRYRIEALDELATASGRIFAYRGIFARDAAFEG